MVSEYSFVLLLAHTSYTPAYVRLSRELCFFLEEKVSPLHCGES